MTAFDWYSATVQADPSELVAELVRANDLSSYRPGRPLHGYTQAAQIVRGDQVLSTVMWGGVNEGVHAFASSSDAIAFARFMRQLFPAHTVSRADVCHDYTEPGSWDKLFTVLRAYAERHRLKTSVAGDWLGKEDGRTFYVGAPSSTVRVRLYEKGIQTGTDPNWVRLELVVRPGNADAKRWLASASPDECWGASRWTKSLAEELLAVCPPRVAVGTVYQPSDDERALTWLLRQYGPLLERVAGGLHGGWDALGPHLLAQLEALRAGPAVQPSAEPVAPVSEPPRQLVLDASPV